MGTSATKNFRNKTLSNIRQTRFEHLHKQNFRKKAKKQNENRPQGGHVNQITLQKPLANIKRTRFEHLQKQNFRKKAKNRMKTAHKTDT